MSPRCWRWSVLGLLLGATAAVVTVVVAVAQGHLVATDAFVVVALCLPGAWLGLLLVRRKPRHRSGPALLGLVTGPLVVQAVAGWAGSFGSARPWPAAGLGAAVDPGVWVLNLAGFVLLCLSFPDGALPGRLWRAAPWLFGLAALATWAAVALNPAAFAAGGGPLPGATPVRLSRTGWIVVYVTSLGGLLAVLGLAVAGLVLRHRRGVPLVRLQLRWLVLGAASVPVLIAAGWVLEGLGASTGAAYGGFMVAMLVVVPGTVAVSILKHDLLDLDRLLATSLSWLLATLVTAAGFALLLVVASELGASRSRWFLVVPALVAALVLVPTHRRLQAVLSRALDRDGAAALSAARAFAEAVRDGTREPEDVEDVLRECLGDRSLRVLLQDPRTAAQVDLTGRPAAPRLEEAALPLSWGGREVGQVLVGGTTPRQLRVARELVAEVRLPLEVSRLRLELRHALAEVRANRARLVEAAAQERRRLERDLHDGAQQGILAVGMRLRSVQRHHREDSSTHAELELAIGTLEQTVAELRRLAHGVRPSRLDDGLGAAVRALVGDSPLPVDLTIGEVDPDEVQATTAYYVVAEGFANTLRHAHAQRVSVAIRSDGPRLCVEYADDGVGGASLGPGLSALRDRVAALDGHLDVVSPPGAGTVLRAEL